MQKLTLAVAVALLCWPAFGQAEIALDHELTVGELWGRSFQADLEDEVYPTPYFRYHSIQSTSVWNEHWMDTKEYEDVEDDFIDDIWDAARHSALDVFRRSESAHNLQYELNRRFSLQLSFYRDYPEGVTEEEHTAVDLQATVLAHNAPFRRYTFDPGIRLRHLDNPGIFFQVNHWSSPNDEVPLRHELLWSPVRERVELYGRNYEWFPDWRVRYDYEDNVVEGRLLNLGQYEWDNKEAGGILSVGYDFDGKDRRHESIGDFLDDPFNFDFEENVNEGWFARIGYYIRF